VYNKIELEFTGKGRILSNLPRYEQRKGQLQMALAVTDSLTSGKNLMIEAGTGIGKSFAYLIPLIYWTMKESKKAVVATGTKVLQNQLASKDLPFLAENSDIPFKFEVLYGQENFFCPRRAAMITQYGLFDDDTQPEQVQSIAEWARTESGVFEDYPEPIPLGLKQQISRRSEACPRKNCSFYNECAYYRKKREAEQADILIVNHHLFFAHIQSGGRLLPEFGAVVFDEAHRLEQVASSYFGIRLSSAGLFMLLSRIYNPVRDKGIVTKLNDYPILKPKLKNLMLEVRGRAQNFFSNLANLLKPYEYKKRIRHPECVPNELEQPLDNLAEFLFEKARDLDDENLSFELISLAERTATAKEAVISFMDFADPNSVYWIEADARTDRVSINSALIDVSETMDNLVWSQEAVNIVTSATLTVGSSFEFSATRVGFKGGLMKIGSPFDYQNNALTYVGHDIVSPKHEAWQERMATRVKELIDASNGRALVLFTSYAVLNKTVELLKEKLEKEHTILVQGSQNRNAILDEFKLNESSVLFATQSFWEGIDVPGESLVMLIITKLPFEVPDDPRAQAILEDYRRHGREPFMEYQLPLSVLRFRQGIGRLIRRDNDYGVIAVLDSRIVKKAYGKLFMDSMPPSPVVFNLLEIRNFFKNH